MWPLLSMLMLGVFGTGIAYVLAATAAGRMGATTSSATAFLIPVVALVLGVVLRHEQVALLSIVGAAICLAGAWLVRQARMSEMRPAADKPPVVPGFPPALRRGSADLRRDRAEAQSAKADSRTP